MRILVPFLTLVLALPACVKNVPVPPADFGKLV